MVQCAVLYAVKGFGRQRSRQAACCSPVASRGLLLGVVEMLRCHKDVTPFGIVATILLLWCRIQIYSFCCTTTITPLVEGEGERFVVGSTARPRRLPGALCRTRWAQLPGEEGERLPDVLHSLLQDGTHGSG